VAEDAAGPGFAYTFGLYEEFKHPELIILGLSYEAMHRVINDAGTQIKNGKQFVHGDTAMGLFADYPCSFRHVNPLQYRRTLSWAMWFYGDANFPALQLFWPDKQNHFPWDAAFNESLRKLQPDLSEPPPSA
jgi:hypothetical protein